MNVGTTKRTAHPEVRSRMRLTGRREKPIEITGPDLAEAGTRRMGLRDYRGTVRADIGRDY